MAEADFLGSTEAMGLFERDLPASMTTAALRRMHERPPPSQAVWNKLRGELPNYHRVALTICRTVAPDSVEDRERVAEGLLRFIATIEDVGTSLQWEGMLSALPETQLDVIEIPKSEEYDAGANGDF